MEYKLAKELKDAGFCGNTIAHGYWIKHDEETTTTEPEDGDIYIPTLSELIEALPGRVKYIEGLVNDAQCVLRKTTGSNGDWYFAYLDGEWDTNEGGYKWRFEAKIPKEAVARLWLALNKRTTP